MNTLVVFKQLDIVEPYGSGNFQSLCKLIKALSVQSGSIEIYFSRKKLFPDSTIRTFRIVQSEGHRKVEQNVVF